METGEYAMKDYLDRTCPPEKRAKSLLSEMSIEEKAAQLVGYMPMIPGRYEELEQYPMGVGQISTLALRGIQTMEQAIQYQHDLQRRVMELSPHHIPAIFHMEGVCGAYIPSATSFPSGLGRASSWNPELEERIGKIVGRQERALGITHTLAPVLDISHDPRMGRQGETYGEDPTLAAAMGSAFVKGLQAEKTGDIQTESVAKHFLGFHAGAAGIHGADAQISERDLREIYGKPFQAAITEAGLKGVMPCYCSINGEPVSVSKEFLTGLLRNEMGFEGVAVSDYGAVGNAYSVQKIGESKTEAGYRALEAGIDQELPNRDCFDSEWLEYFRSGQCDMAILDQAVERVLAAKFRMGLFEQPFALSGKELDAQFSQTEDGEVSLASARQSIVLLKNDGTLPLVRKKQKIAVIGRQAVTARIFFGGYTHLSMAEGLLAATASMAGVRIPGVKIPDSIELLPGTPVQSDHAPEFEALMRQQKPGIRSLLDELRERLPEAEIIYAPGYEVAGSDHSGYADALKAAESADVVLLTLGGKHGTGSIASMGEGIDATDIGLPECQDTFLSMLEPLKKPIVGIHFNGRPISSDVAYRVCNTILEAWNPAEYGAEAIIDILLGAVNPSGRLPISVARNAGQIPIYYNHPNGSSWHQGESVGFPNYVDCPHTSRYPFGHGLSYTHFAYKNLSIDPAVANPSDEIRVSVDVANVGDVWGEEIVQLYIQDEKASMIRPQIELAGFCRVGIPAGESRHIIFRLAPGQLAFLDRDMEWKIEKGTFAVKIGSSSADIRLEENFSITEDLRIDGKTRSFYTIGYAE